LEVCKKNGILEFDHYYKNTNIKNLNNSQSFQDSKALCSF
jgi:hypothetical protein